MADDNNNRMTSAVKRPHLLTAMQSVRTPPLVRKLSRVLFALILLVIAFVSFLPWQQNAKGTGRIVAYHPTERMQTVESPIYGRIVRWGEQIVEGVEVKKGQFILEIRDIDENRAERLKAQVQATSDKQRIAQVKAEAYGRQVVDLTEAKVQLIEASRQLVEEARRKVEAEQQGVAAAEAGLAQTQSNFERQKALFDKGLTAGVSYEKDRRSFEEAQAKLAAAKKYVEAAESYLKSKQAELEQKSLEAETKIDYARASRQEALGDEAVARKDLSEIEGKQSQFESREVVAPRDGIILRLFANNNAEMLKEGDPLFSIVPATTDRAVELWVDGNDIPLITTGREVRLQFEGWPAVQFAAGWPHAAMGTFGGEVASMDATDDGKGKFRILVRPGTAPWPDERFLRQGVRANGWVMLNRVPMGYELWRQLNGFPPIYPDESLGKAAAKDGKKVKLPK